MKNLKKFDKVFEEAPKADMENELKEAFMRYLLNTAGIKPDDVTAVDSYNKYVVISTKNDDPVRIDFAKRYNV